MSGWRARAAYLGYVHKATPSDGALWQSARTRLRDCCKSKKRGRPIHPPRLPVKRHLTELTAGAQLWEAKASVAAWHTYHSPIKRGK
jgi:hypothetical protein